MLVKARFLEKLQTDSDLEHRYLFLLSEQDHAWMDGMPLMRQTGARQLSNYVIEERDKEGAVLFAETVEAAALSRVFVVELPFAPDRPDDGSPGGSNPRMLTLVRGGWYWIMLARPPMDPMLTSEWQRVTLQVKRLMGAVAGKADGIGMYPWEEPQASEVLGGKSMAHAEELAAMGEKPVIAPDSALARLERDGKGLKDADWIWRAVGAVIGLPITQQILSQGLELYNQPKPVTLEAGLTRLYRLWFKSKFPETPIRARRKKQRMAVPPDTIQGLPVLDTTLDLSNPSEYGAPAALLLNDLVREPYAFVGPASSPGTGVTREGQGTVVLYPFWLMDVLAQALHGNPADTEPLAADRSAAVVAETFRQLEHRNQRAFIMYEEDGRPREFGPNPYVMDHVQGSLSFLSPAGSTVFAEVVVRIGVARRTLDLMRVQRSPKAMAFFGNALWENPFFALAGFLGVKLHPLVAVDTPEGLQAALDYVAAPASHPLQVENPGPHTANFQFLSLRSRADVEAALAQRLMRQDQLRLHPKLHRFDIEETRDSDWYPGIFDVSPPFVGPLNQGGVTPSQADAYRMIARWPMCAVTGDAGTGKSVPLDAKLLTPTGWKRMGDIHVGDRVIGRDGKPTPVLAVYPQGELEMFRVTFSDGTTAECSDDHLWLTATRNRKKVEKPRQRVNGKAVRSWHTPTLDYKVRPLSEIRATLKSSQGLDNHQIPMMEPAQLGSPRQKLKLDPYLLGALLGDGSTRNNTVTFTSADAEVLSEVEKALPGNHRLVKRTSRPYDYGVVGRGKGYESELREVLRSYGLWNKASHEKFIPQDYLFARQEDRLAVLQGLLDTDGTASKYQLEFSSASARLADDVKFLVESLGGTATCSTRIPTYTYEGEQKQGRISYRLYITLPPSIEPFRLRRKKEAFTPRTTYKPHRIIRSVEPIGKKPAQCIRVGGEGLYVLEHCIVTHNTHLQRLVFKMFMQATGNKGTLLVLAPTNRAAARLSEKMMDLAPGETLLLGGSLDEPGKPAQSDKKESRNFKLVVGTLDAFSARLENSEEFAVLVRSRDFMVATDECSMVTPERFASVLEQVDPTVNPFKGRLLRVVLVGDAYQLESVEPGNFFYDMMRFVPVVRLREQVRAALQQTVPGQARTSLGLEGFFTLVRASMDHAELRKLVVQYLLCHLTGVPPATDTERQALVAAGITAQTLERFERFGLDMPVKGGSDILRFILVRDLPQVRPESADEYRRFLFDLDRRTRNAVFRAILKWRKAKLPTVDLNPITESAELLPFLKPGMSMADVAARTRDTNTIRQLFTNRSEPPAKVVTMYNTAVSDSGDTEYLSSSQRVNGWFHDFLTGLSVGPNFGERLAPPTGLSELKVRHDDDFWGGLQELPNTPEGWTARQDLLFSQRPDDLVLCQGWPYIVRKNFFRKFGVFRGETIYFHSGSTKGLERRLNFISETGRWLEIPRRLAQARFLSYGWSTNVHQVQGGEYPLVVTLWMTGIPYISEAGVNRAWDRIRPAESTKDVFTQAVTPVPGYKERGDDRLDLRKLYTAITRTQANWKLPIPGAAPAGQTMATGKGQCVIVAGLHALRLFLDLETRERATGFAGTVLRMLEASR